MLRYMNGMSVAQVADLMEQQYRATESLLARARQSARLAHSQSPAGLAS
jgi:DNA-directed RNA polymerase specialized sigma24 family protein